MTHRWIAYYRCLSCGCQWSQTAEMTQCPLCEHLYIQWLNYTALTQNGDIMTEPTSSQFVTPALWQQMEKGVLSTPLCPHCQRHLGIKNGMFHASGRDVWICDSGCKKEFPTVAMTVSIPT